MDKRFLEDCLAQGMSLEAIGRLAGKHPSTVSYWLQKYGMTPSGAAHAPKGGLKRSEPSHW
jgi:IS30 family transposase